jgi:hypothetical protein
LADRVKVLVMNAHAWHGGLENRTDRPRTALQPGNEDISYGWTAQDKQHDGRKQHISHVQKNTEGG